MQRAILTLITRCFTRDETSLKKGAEKSKMPKDEETISIIFYSMILKKSGIKLFRKTKTFIHVSKKNLAMTSAHSCVDFACFFHAHQHILSSTDGRRTIRFAWILLHFFPRLIDVNAVIQSLPDSQSLVLSI